MIMKSKSKSCFTKHKNTTLLCHCYGPCIYHFWRFCFTYPRGFRGVDLFNSDNQIQVKNWLCHPYFYHISAKFGMCIEQGRIQGGGRTRRAPPPPLKLEKYDFFVVKSWFFTRNTSKIFAPPSAIGKKKFFWRKIVIFHTKYPKNFRTSLRSAQFF